ncbi:hypothetical protein [Rhodoferax sp.]|uniref:hypothetical protein n=1 Tax=Rhodoferax sp. TaxID=50421 RepID=UPI002ACF0468|nr:hypothetical protein [Rhodoferax sp.]MDZ7918524.1 hypothetical protein [Rhodoferax sp.]
MTVLFVAFAYLWAFFYAYILVMGIYRAHLAGRIAKWSHLFWLCLPGIVTGWCMDVLANLLIAPIAFLDLPAAGAELGLLPSATVSWTPSILLATTAEWDIKS